MTSSPSGDDLGVYVELIRLEGEVRVLKDRVDSLLEKDALWCELKGWLRLCSDDAKGHAEFYQWASHYFFGTEPPEDEE